MIRWLLVDQPRPLSISVHALELPSALQVVFKPFSNVQDRLDVFHGQPFIFVVRQRLRSSDRVLDLYVSCSQ